MKENKHADNFEDELIRLKEQKIGVIIKMVGTEIIKSTQIKEVYSDYMIDESNELFPFGTFTIQIR